MRTRLTLRLSSHSPGLTYLLVVRPGWRVRALRVLEDVVSADAAPDDVRLSGVLLRPVVKRGPPVACPRHLEDTGMTLDASDPQAAPERPAGAQVVHHLLHGIDE